MPNKRSESKQLVFKHHADLIKLSNNCEHRPIHDVQWPHATLSNGKWVGRSFLVLKPQPVTGQIPSWFSHRNQYPYRDSLWSGNNFTLPQKWWLLAYAQRTPPALQGMFSDLSYLCPAPTDSRDERSRLLFPKAQPQAHPDQSSPVSCRWGTVCNSRRHHPSHACLAVTP